MDGFLSLTLPEGVPARLDKALAALSPEGPDGAPLTRTRLRTLIETGCLSRAGGATVTDPGAKVKPGETFLLRLPEAVAAEPEAEDIPLQVVFEDAHLIVIDKPAGMVVHPAPGAEAGTLVNALLHHCGESLAGIGGERRPGIVHRIDKETTGLLVAAKTEAAHQGLSALFARHDIERLYRALCWGVPERGSPRMLGLQGVALESGAIRIATGIARHRTDRKKMAVDGTGRPAVTRIRVAEEFGIAALVECRLETGRTHQIRVHMAHIGHSLIGDPVYGRPRALPRAVSPALATLLRAFPRQALHAARLGFVHPVTGERLTFESALPADLHHLLVTLRAENLARA